MEDVAQFDIFDHSLGKSELDETFSGQLIHDTGLEARHMVNEDGEEFSLYNLLETYIEKCDDSLTSSHKYIMTDGNNDTICLNTDVETVSFCESEGIETNFVNTSESFIDVVAGKQVEAGKQSNKIMHLKLLLDKLGEKDKTITSCLNEIGELKKKLIDKDVIINELNDNIIKLQSEINTLTVESTLKTLEVGLLDEQSNYDMNKTNMDGSSQMDISNGVPAAGDMIENGIIESVWNDCLKAMEVVHNNHDASAYEDLLIIPQSFAQGENETVNKSTDLKNVSYGEESSMLHGTTFTMSSFENFVDHDPSDGMQKVEEKDNRTSRNFECIHCQKIFTNKQNLEIHVRIHTNERPYPCCICKKSFRQRTALTDHISRLHQCSLDQKLFIRNQGQRGFRCYFCKQLMDCRESYQKHISKNHADFVKKN